MAALPEIGAMNDPGKWGLPGWKTEQKYDRNVLIGNWYEERRKVSFVLGPFSCILTLGV